MAARRTQDLACKEFICCSPVSGSGNTTSHQKQPCLQQMMMCKECKQFGRFACTYCDWSHAKLSMHTSRLPHALCTCTILQVLNKLLLAMQLCQDTCVIYKVSQFTPPHPHPILLTAMDTKVTQTRQHLLSSSSLQSHNLASMALIYCLDTL